ncbi:MAG: DUF2380 domain-containing protein [Gammaproteobacteria bacterium]
MQNLLFSNLFSPRSKSLPIPFAAVLCMVMLSVSMPALAADKTRVVVVDAELVDDMKQRPSDPDKPANLKRTLRMQEQVIEGLELSDRYEILQGEEVDAAIAEQRSHVSRLRDCSECARAIAAATGADIVFIPWAQIVSSLILNQNLRGLDGETGEEVYGSYIDFRSNDDRSWQGATRYMLERFYKKYHEEVPDGLRDWVKQAE